MYDFSLMTDQEDLEAELARYEAEHRELDGMIDAALRSGGAVNFIEIQHLKKRKLQLKDVIQRIRSSLIDDIIA